VDGAVKRAQLTFGTAGIQHAQLVAVAGGVGVGGGVVMKLAQVLVAHGPYFGVYVAGSFAVDKETVDDGSHRFFPQNDVVRARAVYRYQAYIYPRRLYGGNGAGGGVAPAAAVGKGFYGDASSRSIACGDDGSGIAAAAPAVWQCPFIFGSTAYGRNAVGLRCAAAQGVAAAVDAVGLRGEAVVEAGNAFAGGAVVGGEKTADEYFAIRLKAISAPIPSLAPLPLGLKVVIRARCYCRVRANRLALSEL
jgi:hypothetical protein